MKKQITLIALVLIASLTFIHAQIIWDEDNTVVNLAGFGCPEPYDTWIYSETGIGDPYLYPTIATGPTPIFDCRDPYDPLGEGCCPIDSNCRPTTVPILDIPGFPLPDNWTCQASANFHCGQYFTEDDCNNMATVADAINSIELNPVYGEGYCGSITDTWINASGSLCSNMTACECFWSAGTSTCEARSYISPDCEGYSPPGPGYPDCYWKVEDDDGCNQGRDQLYMNWTYTGSDPAACSGGFYESWVDCGNVVKLGFFSLINVALAVIIVAIIYYLYSKKTNKKIKKTPSKKKK